MVELNKEDKDLQEIFHGEEKPLHPDTVHVSLTDLQKNREARKANVEKAVHKPTHDYKDGSWEPVKELNWMDKLKSCAKSMILFCGLSFLIFCWMEAGLMDESIAVPCMCLCTALAGWGVGKNARCK